MGAFVYDMLSSRVIFGAGRVDKLPEEILRLGATRTPVLGVASECVRGSAAAGPGLPAVTFRAVVAR
jgi:hypothetical protein